MRNALRGLLLVMLAACAVRQAGATTLQEALAAGLAMDPQVTLARAGGERAQAELDVAKDGRWPVLSASTGTTSNGQAIYAVSLSQKLYDWGRGARRIDAAEALLRGGQAQIERARNDVGLNIAQVHLELVALEARLAAVARQTERLERLRDLAVQRVAGGYSDVAEQGRVEAELTRLREQAQSLESQRQQDRMLFTELTGLPPLELLAPELPELFSRGESLLRLDDWILLAPQVVQAAAELDAQKHRAREAGTAMWPVLELQGSRTRTQVGGQLYNDSSVGLHLTLDGIQGRSSQDRARAEQMRVAEAEAKLQQARRELRRKALGLIETTAGLRARAPLLRERVAQLAQLAEVYQTQFRGGRRSFSELMTVQLESFDAERQWLDVNEQAQRTPVELAARLGLLLPWLQGQMKQDLSQGDRNVSTVTGAGG